MIIAVDFDDTIVSQAGRAYDDVETPLEFMPGALEGLRALKRAGHRLIVFSGRASRALRVNPMLDPLAKAGVKSVNLERWEKSQPINEARYRQMLDFIAEHLAEVIDAVDDGTCGKVSADLYIDDKALRFGAPPLAAQWEVVASMWGEPAPLSAAGV